MLPLDSGWLIITPINWMMSGSTFNVTVILFQTGKLYYIELLE